MKLELIVLSLLIMTSVSYAAEDLDPATDSRNIERPCPDFDIDCIRKYFWENSLCEISPGPVPDPLFLKYIKVDIANVNLTSELNNVHVKGLNNGDIIEFYINKVTNKLVLAMEVCDLEICSPETLTKYYMKAQEPIERLFHIDFKYDKLTFTVILPTNCSLDLRDAEVYTYVDDPTPQYNIGPSVAYTSDPISHEQYEMLFAGIPADLQETFVGQGPAIMASYIQHNICDFGVEVAKGKMTECCEY